MRIVVLQAGKKKKYVLAVALGLALLAAIVVAALLMSNSSRPAAADRGKLVPVYSVDTQKKAISVTLNAADGDEDIPGILDALDDADVSATFFVLGSWADRYPDALAAIAARGHAVENHSDAHPHMNNMSKDAIAKDIASAGQKIAALAGAAPTLFRAPYGEYNDAVISAARGLGYEAVQWSIDSIDWRGEGEDVVAQRVLKGLHPGGIVLLHTNSKGIVPALARILGGAIEQGYEIVPLSELMLTKPYTVDTLGIQRAGDG